MTEKYCFTVGDDGQKSLDLLEITFNDQSKYFLNKLGLQQGMSVLDIGCGLGTYEFQAQAFYKKHGFYCIVTIPKYLKDYDRIFMRKDVS